MKYDHERIAGYRRLGLSWAMIGLKFPKATSKQLRQAHARWQKRRRLPDEILTEAERAESLAPSRRAWWREVRQCEHGLTEPHTTDNGARRCYPGLSGAFLDCAGCGTRGDLHKDDCPTQAAYLEDLLVVQHVEEEEDTSGRWEVVQKWERTPEGTVHLRAAGPPPEAQYEDIWAAYFSDAVAHAPTYDPPPLLAPDDGDPVLAEICIYDPHFGMLAYHREVGGVNQDTDTIAEEYGAAIEHLVSVSRIYPVDRYLYTVGHDLQHVNSYSPGSKAGVTRKGTPQDMDGRLSRIFTTVRRATVQGVDLAATVAPVDVVFVPGNHDPDENYKLGEVLNAWYRNHAGVHVQYSANKRQFYSYAKNAFMLTHGEELKRQRDNLPMIMLTEMPTDMLVASDGGSREIHTGHNHIRLQGGYYPTAEVSESRGVITRSLPGLTATDAWHHEEGYRHKRAATLLIHRRSGGLVGLHEFNL